LFLSRRLFLFIDLNDPGLPSVGACPGRQAPLEIPLHGAHGGTIRRQARFLGKPLEAAMLPQVAHFFVKLTKKMNFLKQGHESAPFLRVTI